MKVIFLKLKSELTLQTLHVLFHSSKIGSVLSSCWADCWSPRCFSTPTSSGSLMLLPVSGEQSKYEGDQKIDGRASVEFFNFNIDTFGKMLLQLSSRVSLLHLSRGDCGWGEGRLAVRGHGRAQGLVRGGAARRGRCRGRPRGLRRRLHLVCAPWVGLVFVA